MNLSFWIAIMIWAFIFGFWLGVSLPNSGNKPPKSSAAEIDDGLDFYISNKEYRNFLSYDGTTQQKE